MTVDGRRRRYVPLDTLVAFSPFGAKLVEKWGMEGLCAWMLLLAAAKREPVQGTFTYTSEPEAWTKLGAVATAFTFEEFVAFCGRFKQTRKRRSGRVTYVSIPSWEGWNKGYKAQTDSERAPSGDTTNTLKTPSGDVQDTFKTPNLRAADALETHAAGSQKARSEALISAGLRGEYSRDAADECEPEGEGEEQPKQGPSVAALVDISLRQTPEIQPLIDLLPPGEVKPNTRTVLARKFAELPPHFVGLACEELRVADGVRSPVRYLNGIADRMLAEQAGLRRTAAGKHNREWATVEDERVEIRRAELREEERESA